MRIYNEIDDLIFFAGTTPTNFLLATDKLHRQAVRMSLSKSSYVTMPFGSGKPAALDYDPIDYRVYWVDETTKRLYSQALASATPTKIMQLSQSKYGYNCCDYL